MALTLTRLASSVATALGLRDIHDRKGRRNESWPRSKRLDRNLHEVHRARTFIPTQSSKARRMGAISRRGFEY